MQFGPRTMARRDTTVRPLAERNFDV